MQHQVTGDEYNVVLQLIPRHCGIEGIKLKDVTVLCTCELAVACMSLPSKTQAYEFECLSDFVCLRHCIVGLVERKMQEN